MNKNSRIAVAFFNLYSIHADEPTAHKYRRSTTRFNLHIHNVNNLITTRTEGSRSKWLSCLRHEMSSPLQTLRSWVRIPFEAWMPSFVLCLCCSVKAGALRWADGPLKESYHMSIRFCISELIPNGNKPQNLFLKSGRTEAVSYTLLITLCNTGYLSPPLPSYNISNFA
jgi:hypothetical protein